MTAATPAPPTSGVVLSPEERGWLERASRQDVNGWNAYMELTGYWWPGAKQSFIKTRPSQPWTLLGGTVSSGNGRGM